MIPYQRNPYFIGRDRVLDGLRANFCSGRAALAQQALIGQPGIGKTQIAVEYAYRYRDEYQAILWTTAETEDALISDFMRIASILQLPEKDNLDKQLVVGGVKLWLSSTRGWLLVIDNLDDPNLLDRYIPQDGRGHILVTARDQEAGTRTTTLPVEKMGEEDGATLLLRRAKLIPEQRKLNEARENEREQAREIAGEMDGHPLALDQAGAYIAEARCTLHTYCELYQKYRDKLLHERGRRHFGHPYSLAATILLSFEKVKQVSPVAANLLRMCAFLHADDIPEELFAVGDPALPATYHSVAADGLALTQAIRALGRYSFIQYRSEEKTVSLHRLVQEVLRGQMGYQRQLRWANHTVWVMAQTVSHLEPGGVIAMQRYLPHALVCTKLIDAWQIYHEVTVYLIIRVGMHLREIASYAQAEPLCQRGLQLARKLLPPQHDLVIMALHNMALLYERWGDYEQAEAFYLEAVGVCERKAAPSTPVTANIYNSFARLYTLCGKYPAAQAKAEQALAIREALFESDSPEIASSLDMLAGIYRLQRKYRQAEPLLERALAICEKRQESDPLAYALSLNSLMLLYTSQGKHKQARPFCKTVLAIIEKERGPKHPEVAKVCNNIAEVYKYLGDAVQAEHYCKRALAIFEEIHGRNSVYAIPPLSLLAAIYQQLGRYPEAEMLFKEALQTTEEKLGPEHPDVAAVLSAYVVFLREMERYDEADELDEKALHIKRLWLREASPLQMLREENAAFLRKRLRKGGTVYFNGVRMKVEDYLALQTDFSGDEVAEDIAPLEEAADES
jgi:tetratricopeptide (TPR) repeat protein